ncbi:hypothetical protein FRC11_000086, partial [Ceratobasidium sp. 423]
WPDINLEDIPDPPDIEDKPMGSLDLDYGPEFVEHVGPLGSNATDEPLLTDKEIHEIMEMELGDQFNDSEWLRALYQDLDMTEKLGYQVLAKQRHEASVIQDIFDANHYLTLRRTPLDGEGDYHMFDDPQDIALGMATDGIMLFRHVQ